MAILVLRSPPAMRNNPSPAPGSLDRVTVLVGATVCRVLAVKTAALFFENRLIYFFNLGLVEPDLHFAVTPLSIESNHSSVRRPGMVLPALRLGLLFSHAVCG